jgi:serine/threonine-protein kinase RsbW
MTSIAEHQSNGSHDVIELRIAALPENIAFARLTLSGVASSAGAPADVVADLKLAVSETCTNAIQHAYRNGQDDQTVTIRFVVGRNELTVEVEDMGSGFDPVASREWEDGQTDNLGLGLAIVRSVADDVEIESGDDGTKVVFTKSFAAD